MIEQKDNSFWSKGKNLREQVRVFPLRSGLGWKSWQVELVGKLVADYALREAMQRKMVNNSSDIAYSYVMQEVFGQRWQRPMSAFYWTCDSGEVVVQLGVADELSGEAAIHEHLRQSVTFSEINQGLAGNNRLFSGHVMDGRGMRVALFDTVAKPKRCFVDNLSLRHAVQVLTVNGYVCVGAEGDPLYRECELKKADKGVAGLRK